MLSARPLGTAVRGAPCASQRARPVPFTSQHPRQSAGVVRAAPDTDTEEFLTEADRRKAQAEKLRAAEKFMVIGSGTATCKGCGYEYLPEKGDPEFPVPKGVRYEDLPADYVCPVCGAPKDKFESRVKVVAGFAENQRYGLGGNSMTESQKSLLIYGALAAFFALFLAGYALE